MKSHWFKLISPLLMAIGVMTILLALRQAKAGVITPNPSFPAQAATDKYVIIISIDGLRADALSALCPSQLPSFRHMRDQGASTDNARSVFHRTDTVPNHVSMVTPPSSSPRITAEMGEPTPPRPRRRISSSRFMSGEEKSLPRLISTRSIPIREPIPDRVGPIMTTPRCPSGMSIRPISRTWFEDEEPLAPERSVFYRVTRTKP